jgi:ketosteroid isomerase-like protein
VDDNIALLRRSYDAFKRRDLDALLALCDPEIEIASRILQVEGGGAYRGHYGVREWWRNILEVAADLRTDADEVRGIGDVTVTRLRVHGHAPRAAHRWSRPSGRSPAGATG